MASTRRLTAILAADVAGYSRLMGADEEGTLARLKTLRRELSDPKIKEHHGRIVKTTGDGLLVEFGSVVDAVRCAVEVQDAMAARNAEIPADKRIEFRIGINLGDIIRDKGDIFGDGVNIAARLEALAKPGGICVSGAAHDQVRDKLDLTFEDMGEQQVKNIARPVRVCAIRLGNEATTPVASETGGTPLPLPDKPSIAVLPFQNMSGDLLAIQEDRSVTQSYRVLAASYAHMGRLGEAREVIARLREITSAVLPDPILVRKPEDIEFWLSGLRLAMGETE